MNRKLKTAFTAACSAGVIMLGMSGEASAKTRHHPHHAVSQTHHVKHGGKHHGGGHKKHHGHGARHEAAPDNSANQIAPPSATPNNQPLPDPVIAAYYENFNLPGAYTPRGFQRLLQMCGYDTGTVDGVYGIKTIESIRQMLKVFPGKFQPVFDGDPATLTPQQLSDLSPAMYRRVAEIGILGVQAEPARAVMFVRATGSHTIRDGRTMVEGEFIIRTWDGREAFVVERDKHYTMELMTRAQYDQRTYRGEKIYRPEFNSGALNYGRRGGKAYQPPTKPWNPYGGSALPGFAGGVSYGLKIDDTLLNTPKTLSKSFGDLSGNRSWIRMEVLDPEVSGRRDGFGIHVDGATVGKEAGDGTAGCLGVREPYARAFFDMIKQMPENERPSHLSVLPPNDSVLNVKHGVENVFKEFFGFPKKAVQKIDLLFKNSP